MGSYTCFQFDLQNVLTGSGFHFHIKMEKASDNLDSQLGTGKHGVSQFKGAPMVHTNRVFFFEVL